MATTQTRAPAERLGSESSRLPNTAAIVVLALVAAAIAAVAYNARTGAVSPRIANPEVTGVPRPVEFLFGWTGWLVLHQVGTVVMMLALVAVFVWAWRRHPAHPYLLMVAASTAIVWQDPIMNWAPYAVYNPQLWHFPEDWPLVRLSPTIEPFIVIGYSTFYFIGPFFVGSWILRRLQARASVDSSVPPSGEDRIVVLTGVDTKGLEFDGIVVVRPDEIEAESATGRATLYVVLTRATQLLTILR